MEIRTPLRVIKFLLTNQFDLDMQISDFKNLYFLRWELRENMVN